MLPGFALSPFVNISFWAALGLTALQPAAAFARLKAAETCAVTLSADQRLIYKAVSSDTTVDADMFKLVRTKVIALVNGGRLPRSSAPMMPRSPRDAKLLQS
jgi:hypothetical protein